MTHQEILKLSTGLGSAFYAANIQTFKEAGIRTSRDRCSVCFEAGMASGAMSMQRDILETLKSMVKASESAVDLRKNLTEYLNKIEADVNEFKTQAKK